MEYPQLLQSENADDFCKKMAMFGNSRAGGSEWPKLYTCRFIEPGLVNYAEYGNVLVQKPVLDKMAKSFIGKPVVNVTHKNVLPSKFIDEADGAVTRVWYNALDGWYWAEFLVWDKSTQRNCESNDFAVSCAYNVSETKDAQGDYHNISYDQEVVDGEYTHLAVVANPRYEGARIIFNSKGGNMKLKFWEKKKDEAPVLNEKEIDLNKAIIEIDGKDVAFKDALDCYNAANAPAVKLGIDTLIEVDGKKVAVKDILDVYNAKMKNKDEDSDGKGKELAKEEAEEKKRKEIEETKNSLKTAHEDGKHDDKENDNCAMCNEIKNAGGKEHFKALQDAANRRGEPQLPKLVTIQDQVKEGKKRYGQIANEQ